jgi:hypothetical protein
MNVGSEDLFLWNIPNYSQAFILYHIEVLDSIFMFIAPGFKTTVHDKYNAYHFASSCEFGNQPSSPTKCWGNYQVATQLVVSRIVLSSIELVS